MGVSVIPKSTTENVHFHATFLYSANPLLIEKQWYCLKIFTKVAAGILVHVQNFSGNSDKNYYGPVVMGVSVIPKSTFENVHFHATCQLFCILPTHCS